MAPTKKSESSSTKMMLKLLIDKSRNRVLFAEAGKDFVDFLFGLLQLPVGAILGLLAEHGTATNWSIAKVYESVQSMDSNYMQPNQSKISLLSPKCLPSNTKQTPMLEQFVCTDTDSSTTHLPAFPPTLAFGVSSSAPAFGVSSATPAVSFSTTCGSSSSSFSSVPAFGVSSSGTGFSFTTTCGSSSSSFSSVPAFGVSSSGTAFSFATTCGSSSSSFSSALLKEATVVDGYVKEMVKYMVLDDLTVKPMSTCEDVITSLNSHQVANLADLQLKITEIDMEVALKLVKALFQSARVLTDVFLRAESDFHGDDT